MKLIVEIEVDEDVYKDAICEQWRDRFGDAITPDEVATLNNPEDFQHCVCLLDLDTIKSIKVVK